MFSFLAGSEVLVVTEFSYWLKSNHLILYVKWLLLRSSKVRFQASLVPCKNMQHCELLGHSFDF